MGNRRIVSLAAVMAAFMLVAGLMIGIGGRVSAQDEEAMAGMPAHLHLGTCDAPGEVVVPLSDVGDTYLMDGTPVAGAWMGPESAMPVYASVTNVPVALADIVAGGHTLVVHESAENIQNYVACGDVGGMMIGASDLPFGLGELNDSGMSGIGWLTDNGDGSTTVTVLLTSYDDMEDEDDEDMEDMEDMDEATPTS